MNKIPDNFTSDKYMYLLKTNTEDCKVEYFWYYFKEHNFSIYRITPFGTVYLSKYREILEKFNTTNYISINKP